MGLSKNYLSCQPRLKFTVVLKWGCRNNTSHTSPPDDSCQGLRYTTLCTQPQQSFMDGAYNNLRTISAPSQTIRRAPAWARLIIIVSTAHPPAHRCAPAWAVMEATSTSAPALPFLPQKRGAVNTNCVSQPLSRFSRSNDLTLLNCISLTPSSRTALRASAPVWGTGRTGRRYG